jgi:hypothetical protein
VVPSNTRDANPTRLRKSLQAGRDIDGIAKEIVALNHDIANVHPDAEPHLLTGRSTLVLLGYGVLNLDSTLHGIHGACEICDETVTRRVEDPTTMRGDQVIDDDPVGSEEAKGADLISAHKAAVAFDIRCEDRRGLLKGGIAAITRSLAVAYAPQRVRVNAIAPSATMTERVKKLVAGNAALTRLANSHLLGLIEPEDIASTALYVASDESRIVTGQVLPVDSGVTIS